MRKALSLSNWVVVILILVAVFSGISQIGPEKFFSKAKDNPVAAVVFTQSLSNLTPFTKVGPIRMPGVDFLDFVAIFLLMGIVTALSYFKGWNKALLTAVLLFPVWLLWKGIMFLVYLWSAHELGFTTSEAISIMSKVTISQSLLAPILFFVTLYAVINLYFKVKGRR